MAHPAAENLTPFAFEMAFASDEDARLLFVPIVKAAYEIQPDGSLTIAPKQVPVNLAGELWGEPGKSSYKYEPECAFTKPATDVVLIGHAEAGRPGITEVRVRLRLGPLDKTVRVVGDRYWLKTLGMVSMTSPEPFERIPLVYERAFGGWDRSHPDPDRHSFEPRNPVGTGFRSKDARSEDSIRLPNLEDPRAPIRAYGDTPPPAGFGFTSPDWQPRAGFAGSYDDRWKDTRMPLLPADFDRRFFNAASPGLVTPEYLKGDEPVSIENVSPRTIAFRLPGVPPANCRVHLTGQRDTVIQTNLDTVILNTDENLVLLIWRGHLALRNGPHDVVSVQVQADGISVPATVG